MIALRLLAKFFGSHCPPYDSTPDSRFPIPDFRFPIPDSLKLGNNMSI
ncbi:MAG: hypothetical protein F6K65_08570 [Moorea sp. SIO3C2]|nr:hypothetical protein [Moorena sp. SIO3C2]